jgi:hypothetical protein
MARNVRQIDEDDAFDENGILRDGRSIRVHMMMRDGADHLSDLQRAVLTDAATREAIATRDATARSFGLRDGLALSRPGFRYNTSDTADTNREKLYDGYQRDMGERWRGADSSGQPAGAQCTVREGGGKYGAEGSPGIMQMIDGELRCVATRRDDSRSDSRRDDSGSNNESHQSRMEKLYAARDADLSEAWRSRS